MAVDLPKVHEQALEHTGRYVAGVKDVQWSDPTPDDEWDRPIWQPGPPCYLLGLDLGQANDYTAWTVSERAVEK